jgi:hypothetical protein
MSLLLRGVVRNFLDCRVKRDNDKNDVRFWLLPKSNIHGLSFRT